MALLWGPLASKASKDSSTTVSTGISPIILYQSPYDWSNLTTNNNGLLSYTVGTQTLSRSGIDVSEHQGSIDWSKVSAAGVEFAYIRVGYRTTDQGTLSADAYASQNLSGATNAGLMVGVYFIPKR
uniref:Glyco_hydro_25 n=1 Tax=uncultured Olsenella sp. TaxID=190764 RepID=A0A060C1M4_9ACTN|nr:Glyco_hydro_25 [uncultured Olsenella sp.]